MTPSPQPSPGGRGGVRDFFNSLLERAQLRARFASTESAMDDAERQFASERVEVLVEEVLPRFFRGPYLIALWALFESGIFALADYLAQIRQLPLKLCDIRGQDPIQRWRKYFTHVASFPLNVADSTWQSLDELRQVRHVLAHANGRLDLAKENARRKLEKWCRENRGLFVHSNLLIVSAEYTRAAQVLVADTLSGLIARIRSDVPG